MNLKIGAIIKRLRNERNMTQDTLACALGVTPQAISRWEQGNGYPDMDLLPLLADVFSVSTDELLGYRLSEREQELIEVKKEIDRLSEVGSVEQCLAYARQAASRYPFDWEIKQNLACCLYPVWEQEHDAAVGAEIEMLCKSIIDGCRDEDIRYDTIYTLNLLYRDMGQAGKARQLLQLLSPMKYCREFALSAGIGDGNTEVYIQDEIDKLTDCLGLAIRSYVLSEDLPNDASTWDKKIGMLRVANKLYDMIYGEDLLFHHNRIAFNHWIISTYEIAQGKVEAALDSLERMCAHTLAYDDAYANDHGKYFSSVFCDKLTYPEPGKEFHELTEHTQSYYMLERMQHERYDCVREHERFTAVVAALQEKAR